MKHSIRRIAVAGTLVAGLLAAAAPAAHATGQYLNAVGSDTTYFVMDQLSRSYNVSSINDLANDDVVLNTPPLVALANDGDIVNKVFPAGSVVPSDSNCASTIISTNSAVRGITGITGVTGVTFEAPANGSGAGKTKVLASGAVPNSCYDIGRSSSGPGTEAGTTEYWAYALDAVSWIKFPGNVVTTLTKDELKSIYNCDVVTGAPLVTDWSGVAGGVKSGPIKRYIAQVSSGTGKFFAKMINGADTNLNTNCTGLGLAGVTQENDGRGIATVDQANAIYYYSYGQAYAQSKGVLADLRNKSVLGSITQSGTPVKPGPSTINTSATRFLGTRYVYNILDTRNPDYRNALRFVGAGDLDNNVATPAENGFLCSNTASTTIKLYGFIPLKKVVDPATTIQSYCVKNGALV
ncbi:MAG: substrate-binding domain-containing protein [Actinomycetes bacterium]